MTQTTKHEPTEETAETDFDEQLLNVLDPKEYNQNQRLKEIHKARRHVVDCLDELHKWGTDQEHSERKARLNYAISTYVLELEPLMQLSEFDDMFEISTKNTYDNIFEFAYTLGYDIEKDDHASRYVAMEVFRICNQFMAQVGLDLEIDDGLPVDELSI